VAGLWLDVDEPKRAVEVARGLTTAVPFNADAWVFQGELQRKADLDVCASAAKAVDLDEELAAAHALRGDCLAARRDMAKAKAAYAKAAELAAGTVEAADYQRRARRL
jgi:tetratricopeptide (TPR) repeat protein